MRGRIPFTHSGSEYYLRFTTNRLCLLEEKTGRTVMAWAKVLETPEGIAFKDLRDLFQAGVFPQVTAEQAGDIMDDLGYDEIGKMIGKAMNAAFTAGDVPEGKDQGNPRVAAA